MTQRLHVLRLNLHQPDSPVRVANSALLIACSLLCGGINALSLWAYALEQLSGSYLALMFAASTVVMLWNRHLSRASAHWLTVEHSGNVPIVLISEAHENKIELNAPPRLQADWLAFHRLGRLAWLSLKLSNAQNKDGLRQVLFLWQGLHTNLQEPLKDKDALKDWARRWHTLQNMTKKNSATLPLAEND